MELFFIEKLKDGVIGVLNKVKKVAVDDPRRVIHSIKVGLALTFVSVFYYVNPLYDGFGVSTMWAVLTVVFVMEYTVGGTLGRSFNRAFATLVAGALGVGVHHLAVLSGSRGEPIILGSFVFLLASGATFSRFIPGIKEKYDYGVVIFILTFSLVAISSYRVDELLTFAHQRLSTVAIGGAICIIISIGVYPVWAGGELHDLIALNLDILATHLDGLASDYFEENGLENKAHLHQAYKSVLNSKTKEESLANLARWEPGHGKFSFRHPWKKYLKVGASARQCAYYIEALNAHITKSKVEASSESQLKIQELCKEMCLESSTALRELSIAIRTMTISMIADTHVAASTTLISSLNNILLQDDMLSDVLHVATIGSMLTEVVISTQNIAKSTEELALSAGFKNVIALPKVTVKPISEDEGNNHVSIRVE